MNEFRQAIFALCFLSATSAFSQLRPELVPSGFDHYNAAEIRILKFEAIGGGISIYARETTDIIVRSDSPDCAADISTRTQTFIIRPRPMSSAGNDDQCRFSVWVPNQIDVEGSSKSGPMMVDSIAGRLRVDSVSGQLSAVGVRGPSLLKTESGSVSLMEVLSTNMTIETSSGSIIVESDTTPSRGLLSLKTVSGNIQLQFSEDANVRISASSSGRVMLMQQSKAKSNFHVSAVSRTGAIDSMPKVSRPL